MKTDTCPVGMKPDKDVNDAFADLTSAVSSACEEVTGATRILPMLDYESIRRNPNFCRL